jgi:hypothetical protein
MVILAVEIKGKSPKQRDKKNVHIDPKIRVKRQTQRWANIEI